ncbi:MAG: glycosyltransferase family A protein [bacterium]
MEIKNNEIIDICVLTYNRLPYLKKCIWSILASTKINFRLLVLSDNSTDGTNEWLLEMKKRKKIDVLIINENNIGSAKSFNKLISKTESKYFVMCCDDIYFHRGWDETTIKIINDYDDCGIVTFFDYARLKIDSDVVKVTNNIYKLKKTGLAATIINKKIFDMVGGFKLPNNKKMGWFATPFCLKTDKINFKRKKHYITVPEFANRMDHVKSKLNEDDILKNYILRREKIKK